MADRPNLFGGGDPLAQLFVREIDGRLNAAHEVAEVVRDAAQQDLDVLGLLALELGDVDAGAYIPGECAAGVELRPGVFEQRAILAAGAAQAILGLVRAAGLEGGVLGRELAMQIVGVDALHPAAAELALLGPSAELEPRRIEVGV